jgi:hypothetical protein
VFLRKLSSKVILNITVVIVTIASVADGDVMPDVSIVDYPEPRAGRLPRFVLGSNLLLPREPNCSVLLHMREELVPFNDLSRDVASFLFATAGVKQVKACCEEVEDAYVERRLLSLRR